MLSRASGDRVCKPCKDHHVYYGPPYHIDKLTLSVRGSSFNIRFWHNLTSKDSQLFYLKMQRYKVIHIFHIQIPIQILQVMRVLKTD